MLESERVVQEGIVKEDFLKAEERNDFYVDENRKKLWAISLDLLLQFDQVCRKHSLRWFATYGTLLGAVRHKGFIPWDDDIDIMMLREDFDALYRLSKEFREPYFLQTPYTDDDYFFTTIKIRNTKTAYIDFPFKYQGFNQGISLDIAPLDYAPVDLEERENTYKAVYNLIMDNSTYMRMSNPYLNERDKKRVANYKGQDPLLTYEEIHDIARQQKKSDEVWFLAQQHYGIERSIFPKEIFDNQVILDFEGVKIQAPNDYEYFLSIVYGNYMALPPMSDRGNWHSNVTVYPDTPYEEVLR